MCVDFFFFLFLPQTNTYLLVLLSFLRCNNKNDGLIWIKSNLWIWVNIENPPEEWKNLLGNRIMGKLQSQTTGRIIKQKTVSGSHPGCLPMLPEHTSQWRDCDLWKIGAGCFFHGYQLWVHCTFFLPNRLPNESLALDLSTHMSFQVFSINNRINISLVNEYWIMDFSIKVYRFFTIVIN